MGSLSPWESTCGSFALRPDILHSFFVSESHPSASELAFSECPCWDRGYNDGTGTRSSFFGSQSCRMLTVAPLGPGPVRWAARGLEATQSHSDHGKHIHHSINFSWVRRRYACEKLIERSGVGVCHDTEAFLLDELTENSPVGRMPCSPTRLPERTASVARH